MLESLSLRHIAHIRTRPLCICGKPRTCVIHIRHVGSGIDRKKPNERHFLAGPGCDECHAILDGRKTKESRLDYYREVTGIDMAHEFLIILARFLWREIECDGVDPYYHKVRK